MRNKPRLDGLTDTAVTIMDTDRLLKLPLAEALNLFDMQNKIVKLKAEKLFSGKWRIWDISDPVNECQIVKATKSENF